MPRAILIHADGSAGPILIGTEQHLDINAAAVGGRWERLPDGGSDVDDLMFGDDATPRGPLPGHPLFDGES